jgi:hypothetical protein
MKYLINIISILLIITGINCGSDEAGLYVSGVLKVDTGKDMVTGPAFVVIATTDDFEMLQENMADYMVAMINVNEKDYSFVIDLAGSQIKPGDKITIFGFIDNDYSNGIPDLSVGDYLGFYFDEDTMETTYELLPGLNKDIEIVINRRVYDYEASVTGTCFRRGRN